MMVAPTRPLSCIDGDGTTDETWGGELGCRTYLAQYGKLSVNMNDTHLGQDLPNGEGKLLLRQSGVLDGPCDKKNMPEFKVKLRGWPRQQSIIFLWFLFPPEPIAVKLFNSYFLRVFAPPNLAPCLLFLPTVFSKKVKTV